MFFLLIILSIYRIHKQEQIRKRIIELVENSYMFTPEEFFELRSSKKRNGGLVVNEFNDPGIYILYNLNKELYYVGQGKKVLNRINAHFSGSGNGDVYADYKYGDSFGIRIVDLTYSGYSSLNELEKHTIEVYDAYKSGYNKNRGISRP